MAKRSKARRSTVRTWPLYLVLAIVFILYIYYQHVQSMAIILGASLFFIIIVLVVLELINSLGEKHYVRDMLELAIANRDNRRVLVCAQARSSDRLPSGCGAELQHAA